MGPSLAGTCVTPVSCDGLRLRGLHHPIRKATMQARLSTALALGAALIWGLSEALALNRARLRSAWHRAPVRRVKA
jgi:hypothetical protein